MSLNPVQSLRRAEAKLEKQLDSIQVELDRVRGALQMLRGGKSADGRKKRRQMSAATKARMSKAARLRWAKVKEKKSA